VRNYLFSKREEPPRLEVLEKLFETLFFASLRREETQPTSCRVAFIETRNSAAKPSTASISQRRRPQRAETAVSSLSAGLVSKLYGTGGKAIHRKSVKRPLKQPARTARLRLVFPSGKAWATSARQYRSAAGQTFRFRTPGIQISAVSKVGPPVSAADD